MERMMSILVGGGVGEKTDANTKALRFVPFGLGHMSGMTDVQHESRAIRNA